MRALASKKFFYRGKLLPAGVAALDVGKAAHVAFSAATGIAALPREEHKMHFARALRICRALNALSGRHPVDLPRMDGGHVKCKCSGVSAYRGAR